MFKQISFQSPFHRNAWCVCVRVCVYVCVKVEFKGRWKLLACCREVLCREWVMNYWSGSLVWMKCWKCPLPWSTLMFPHKPFNSVCCIMCSFGQLPFRAYFFGTINKIQKSGCLLFHSFMNLHLSLSLSVKTFHILRLPFPLFVLSSLSLFCLLLTSPVLF